MPVIIGLDGKICLVDPTMYIENAPAWAGSDCTKTEHASIYYDIMKGAFGPVIIVNY